MMHRVRWALARRLVGPIIRDPGEGVTVVIREGGYSATFKARRFRFKSTNRPTLRRYDYPGEPFAYRANQPFSRFVGVL